MLKDLISKKIEILGLIKSRKAFTILEAILVTTLVSIVFSAAIASLMPIMGFFRAEQHNVTMSDDLGIALEGIKKDAIEAEVYSISGAGTILTLNVIDRANTNRTQNRRYSIDGNGNLIREVDLGPVPDGWYDQTRFLVKDMAGVNFQAVKDANNIDVPNCFSVSLAKNNLEQPSVAVTKRATVMLRCTSK